MTSKTLIAGLVALAFVTGTIMTGTMVYAEHKPDHQSNSGGLAERVSDLDGHVTVLKESQTSTDSFFDVFFDVEAGATAPDSFFDIFLDLGEERIIDSFFDIFVELHETDEQLQDQIDALVSNPPSESASSTAYIKFDGVDGEAQDNAHKAWSDLLSFDQGQRSSDAGATGESRRRGDVIMDDVVVVKELDKSSPKIAEAVTTGKVFPKVEIHVTKSFGDAGSQTYYAYELKNVLVTSYNISGSGQAEDVPAESFSLNFEEIKVTYTEYDSDGTDKGNAEYTWKVEEGES